jgi:signal transduction histidine kinase
MSSWALARRGGPFEPDYPALLPSALISEPGDGPCPRRSPRDWFVDIMTVLLSFVLGSLIFMMEADDPGQPGWLLLADALCGSAACGAIWWRRRWPVQVCLALMPVLTFSAMAVTAGIVALFAVAVHRRAPVVAALGGLFLLTGIVYSLWRPDDDLPFWASVLLNVFITATVVGWGMLARARRQLVFSLHERARRAEAEQQLRVEQGRHLERARIALEMHDVLAHRISLVSLHAGALEFRGDVPPQDVAKSAAVIRASANQALQDLREILGVLRAEVAGVLPETERPQPTLCDVNRLIQESVDAGTNVTSHVDLEAASPVPDSIGRTAYRVVQEGLTNARKHAPGTEVTVAISGRAGSGLNVEVRNRWPIGRANEPSIPGAGQGLIGLTERTIIAGGRLDSGRTPEGDFRLGAWLPWPA